MPERILLLTGFEPFGGELRNPSLELAEALGGLEIGGCRVVSRILPVDTERMPSVWHDVLDIYSPRLAGVVHTGLARGRAAVCLERVAVNCRDFSIPDNGGHQPLGDPILNGGPAAYFSTLPLQRTLAALREAGVPAQISNSAGTYLCNQVMYTTLHALEKKGLQVPSGFVHLPCLPEQVARSAEGVPSLAFDIAQRAIRIVLEMTARP